MRKNQSEFYEYNDYDDYLNQQKELAQNTTGRTVIHNKRRIWIYDRMMENNVVGKTFLCVGARHKIEIDFFKNKGYDAEGIDIIEGDGIIQCDMSRMDEHKYLKDKTYDIIYSCESIEHCLDFDGFVRCLNKMCNSYFICFCPHILTTDRWDCHKPFFMDNAEDSVLFKEELESLFTEFSVIFNKCYDRKKGHKKILFILKKRV